MVNDVPLQLSALKGVSPKRATLLILGLSSAVFVVLLFVLYGHGRSAEPPAWLSNLPALNALLNATSATWLCLAYRAIRRRDVVGHVRCVLAALTSSALFLVSYIVYHSAHGDTHFAGRGLIVPIYFFILVTHVVLSAVALPLIFSSLFFSLSGRFAGHRKIARWALPVWLYVSVTGVLVFVLLRAFG